MKILRALCFLLLTSIILPAQTVPALVNYQGRLLNPDGSPLGTGNCFLTFKVWDAASGGNLIWGPQIFDGLILPGHGAMIPVVQGYFNVVLGPADTIGGAVSGAFTGTNRFVEVTVSNHVPIAPRQQLLTAPFAFQSGNTATLAGADWSAVFGTNDPVNGKIPSAKFASNITVSGTLTLPAAGTVFAGPNLFLSALDTLNFFAGPGAGNLTMSGDNNTALGAQALKVNTSGKNNTAAGEGALSANTSGRDGTALGYQTLVHNTSGGSNTAVGSQALANLTTGYYNTASGFQAMFSATTSYNNTVTGVQALMSNTAGTGNTAYGFQSMTSSTNGKENTAIGVQALYSMKGANQSTAVGSQALYYALGENNIGLGANAGVLVTGGSNNIEIGSIGNPFDNGTIRIGSGGTHSNVYVAGVFGSVLGSGVGVFVSSAGEVGTAPSSARFKENIRTMGGASDALLSLRPVTFQYKSGLDPKATPQFGLVAEEVAKVDPNLVVRDDKNQIYGVRYEAVNAMLLNEFLKVHRTVEEQKKEIAGLREKVTGAEAVEKRLRELEESVRVLKTKK